MLLARFLQVAPKRAALAAAQAQLDATLASLAEAQAKLGAVQAKIAALERQFAEASAKKAALAAQVGPDGRGPKVLGLQRMAPRCMLAGD